MKKLFFLFVLFTAAFTTIQAQDLTIEIENTSTTDTWEVKVVDNQSQVASFTIGPNSTQTATITGFEFDVQVVGSDAFNCEHEVILSGAASGTATSNCLSTNSLTYNMAGNPFTPNWNLRITVN
ncbi:MAG: hypothetical protein AAFZ15_29295 [Bacteroidota bacterium]